MGNRTHPVLTLGEHVNPEFVAADGKSTCLHRSHREAHDIRLHRVQVDAQSVDPVDAFRQQSRVFDVLGQVAPMLVERVQSARGDDAGLPKAAAELLLEAPGACDRLDRARERGPHGRA